MRILALLSFLAVDCDRSGHADSAYEACIDSIDLLCECDDADGGEAGWACDLSESERAMRCDEYNEGTDRDTNEWLDWWNCRNEIYADECADADLSKCGESPIG